MLFDKNFNSGKDNELSTLNSYLPVVSASLCFLMRLRKRTLLPIECMKLIDHPLINDKMENVLKDKYEELEVICDKIIINVNIYLSTFKACIELDQSLLTILFLLT